MHKSAMLRMRWFVENYIPKEKKSRVLDVGSYDVNGSYRSLFDNYSIEYVGLDMESGPNVDFVPSDPYNWKELKDESFDFVISGNAFEHIEYPWLTIKEIYRILKKGGFVFILAPNSIFEHRYPVDCYRYYADGFRALAKWGGFQLIDVSVSGVPDMNVDDEWYNEGMNDTTMLLTKSNGLEDFSVFPVFKGEIRYRHASEWEIRFRLLLKWICTESKGKKIKQYFEEKGYDTVYLYGYGDIGRILYEELRKLSGIDLRIIDKKGGKIEGKSIIKPDEIILADEKTCIINAVLDNGMFEELNELYPDIEIISMFDILNS